MFENEAQVRENAAAAASPGRDAAVAMAVLNALVCLAAFCLVFAIAFGGSVQLVGHRIQQGGWWMYAVLVVLSLLVLALLGLGLWHSLSRKAHYWPLVAVPAAPLLVGFVGERVGVARMEAVLATAPRENLGLSALARMFSESLAMASYVWQAGLLASAFLLVGCAGVVAVASLARRRAIGFGKPTVIGLVASTMGSALAVGLGSAFATSPQPEGSLLFVGLLVAATVVHVVVLGLVRSGSDSPEKGSVDLGEAVLLATFSLGAMLLGHASFSRASLSKLLNVLGGQFVDPAEVGRLARNYWAQATHGATTFPYFYLPLLVMLGAALFSAAGSRGSVMRALPTAGAVALCLAAGLIGGHLGHARDGRTLLQLSAHSLPEDVTLLRKRSGRFLDSENAATLFVGKTTIQTAAMLFAKPQKVGATAELEGPHCVEPIHRARARLKRGRIMVAMDESLTVRHMACVLIGLKHRRLDRHPDLEFPFGIVAGQRDRNADFDTMWISGASPEGLPQHYAAIGTRFGAVYVDLAGRRRPVHVIASNGKWEVEHGGEKRTVTGSIAERLAIIRADNDLLSTLRTEHKVSVSAAADVALAEVLQLANAVARLEVLALQFDELVPRSQRPPVLVRLPDGQLVPKGSPRGPVVIGPTSVAGQLPPEVIQRIVGSRLRRFRMCYEQGLAREPSLEGTVSVRFAIGLDGSVSHVANGGSDLRDSGVVQCVVQMFYGLSFPQPEGDIVTVVQPLMFKKPLESGGWRPTGNPRARSDLPTR